MRTIAKRSALTIATLGVAAATTLVAAPAASASDTPQPGWRRVYAAPASYCIPLLGQYASKGYLTTGCHYYGTPATGTGGWFDIHRG